ncbi:MAG: endolytic transglycosylase MltG [Clostridiales bacterium]|nr:endolytic transglycosylase MltG [Clostridiales bacterium]
MKSFLIALLIFILIIGTGVGAFYVRAAALSRPVELSEPVTVKIDPGSGCTKIASVLYNAGLVRNAGVFKNYADERGVSTKLRPGEYTFEGKVTLEDLVAALLRGGETADNERVTIPEGLTVKQTAEIFAAKGLVNTDKFIEYTQITAFPAYDYLPPPGTPDRLTGFLFPDTYDIDPRWTEREIVNMMLARFDNVFTAEWRARAQQTGRSVKEIVVMASIIEKEAKMAVDRPLISGVFYNRLEINMLLQSCATVQYVLGEPKPNLTQKDLDTPSPYNTYLHKGLPPGPIACPGKDSLRAALYPAEHDYLYFLAKPDGYHVFNETYAGHLSDRDKYLK